MADLLLKFDCGHSICRTPRELNFEVPKLRGRWYCPVCDTSGVHLIQYASMKPNYGWNQAEQKSYLRVECKVELKDVVVKYLHIKCSVHLETYSKGGVCIQLKAAEDNPKFEIIQGEPMGTATRWVPNIPEGYVVIRNTEENEGILDVLQAAGIVGPVEKHIPSGFITMYQCKLLITQ